MISQYSRCLLLLRKVLLNDYIFYLLLIIVLLITSIRLIIPNNSMYSEKSNYFKGILVKKIIKDEKVSFYIKNKETIIASFYSKDLNIVNKYNLGDLIYVEGSFNKPSTNTTEYLFNYQKYLNRNNIFYLVEVNKIKKIRSSKNIYYILKQKLIKRLNYNPYLYTFILGDKSYLKKDVKKSYQENGISHLFAISGMHISLLVLLITKILEKCKLREEILFKIILIVLLLYLLLVGFSASIVRGILFYMLFSINRIYFFYIKPINIFSFIVSISLLINPNYLFDVGYLYSYLISFSLLLLSKYLNSKSYIINLLKVSTISFIVSLPITLYNFYQFNILSIVYNLLFVPFVSFIIFPLSLLVVLLSFLEPVYDYLINILEGLSLVLNNIYFGKIVFKRIHILFYYLYFIIIMFFLLKRKKCLLLIVVVLLLIHFLLPYVSKDNYLEIIDVGQGDSSLIHINNKSILIDTGGITSYYNKNTNNVLTNNTLIPLFRSSGINRINYLIITHGDFDHMGEAINLVKNFKVEKVIFNCGSYNDLEKELIKVLNKKKIKYYSCIKELNIDDNKLYFLQTKEYDNENDNSNVIYTELNGYRFMFMGDASVTTEKEILNKYNLSDIDVLKVGHHGSKTSSGNEFINEINPKYSIISVGKNNRYGHPNKEVIETLKDSKIYRTDLDGSIMFKIKNNELKIETCSP